MFVVADACRSIRQEAGAAMLQRLAREGVVQVTCDTVPLKSCSGHVSVHSRILGSEGVDEAPMDSEAEADSHSEQADTEADADMVAAIDAVPASV